jgi:hypothetical protein
MLKKKKISKVSAEKIETILEVLNHAEIDVQKLRKVC